MKMAGVVGKLTGKLHLRSSEGGSLTGEITQRDGTQAKPGATQKRWMESVGEELCSQSTRCKKDKCRNANRGWTTHWVQMGAGLDNFVNAEHFYSTFTVPQSTEQRSFTHFIHFRSTCSSGGRTGSMMNKRLVVAGLNSAPSLSVSFGKVLVSVDVGW